MAGSRRWQPPLKSPSDSSVHWPRKRAKLTVNRNSPNMLLSASRDKSLIIWNLTREEGGKYGYPRRSLHGHSHIVSDCVRSPPSVSLLAPPLTPHTRSYPPTAPTLSPPPGIRLSGFGNSQQVQRPGASSATPTTSSLSHSRPTTARLSRAHATAASSYGIPWVTASILSRRRATRNGSAA